MPGELSVWVNGNIRIGPAGVFQRQNDSTWLIHFTYHQLVEQIYGLCGREMLAPLTMLAADEYEAIVAKCAGLEWD